MNFAFRTRKRDGVSLPNDGRRSISHYNALWRVALSLHIVVVIFETLRSQDGWSAVTGRECIVMCLRWGVGFLYVEFSLSFDFSCDIPSYKL